MATVKFVRQLSSILVLLAVAALASLTMAEQQQSALPGTTAAIGPAAGRAIPAGGLDAVKGAERLREGTRLIDVMGTFQAIGGDSVSFSPTASGNKDSFRVLENLALERISTALEANRGPRQWIVSGTITEYRGTNYLLVTRAVIQLQEGDSAAGQ
jgi:hypothetical protein